MDQIKLTKEYLSYFETVTSFINNHRKELATCLNFKGFKFEGDEFVSIGISPVLLGTMLDILASWHINGKIEIDKYGMDTCHLFLGWIDKESIFKKAHIAGLLTIRYRSGYPIDMKEAFERKFTNEEIEKLTLLHNRIKNKLDKEKDKIDNPNFFSEDYLLRGDGDYIHGTTLCDFKSSKVPSITLDYIRQLFMYWFLDNDSIDSYKIDTIEIYNPLYDYTFSVKIKDVVSNTLFLEEIKPKRQLTLNELQKQFKKKYPLYKFPNI